MAHALLKKETAAVLSFLAQHPPPPTPAAARDVAGVLLGLHGLRIQEICNLRVDDFDPRQCTIRVSTLKGGPAGRIPLTPAAAEAIRIHLKHRGTPPPGSPLLATRSGRRVDQRNLRRRWHTWAAKAIDRKPRFHDLRHTTAAHAYDASGKDVRVVQRLLRHQKVSTTEIYLPDAQIDSSLIPGAQQSNPRPPKNSRTQSSGKSTHKPSKATPPRRKSGSSTSNRQRSSGSQAKTHSRSRSKKSSKKTG